MVSRTSTKRSPPGAAGRVGPRGTKRRKTKSLVPYEVSIPALYPSPGDPCSNVGGHSATYEMERFVRGRTAGAVEDEMERPCSVTTPPGLALPPTTKRISGWVNALGDTVGEILADVVANARKSSVTGVGGGRGGMTDALVRATKFMNVWKEVKRLELEERRFEAENELLEREMRLRELKAELHGRRVIAEMEDRQRTEAEAYQVGKDGN